MISSRTRFHIRLKTIRKSHLILVAVALARLNCQDVSSCCTRALGTCRSVCEKMSLLEPSSDSAIKEDIIDNVYKFCGLHQTEFWICMNQTIQEVVSGESWWASDCCSLARAPGCARACPTAGNEHSLITACRRSDELPLYDCLQRHHEAHWCCSQTHSPRCHEACASAARGGDAAAWARARDACDSSPALLHCMRDLASPAAPVMRTDTSKYMSCCGESSNASCRRVCEAALAQGDAHSIADALSERCGAPALHDALWQCFLRKDAPETSKDVIPRDIAKLHCCQKAATVNCKKQCFDTYNTGWQNNWHTFHTECLGDPQEVELSLCIEEVDAPCTLGCEGLTYCSHFNNRPTTLFRSCTAQADLDAHLAVAQQKESGTVNVSGITLPLRNSSQCSTEVWKSVACALHVKPCTHKGHSSQLCSAECLRVVSACVDWERAPARLTARALCARLAPPQARAACLTMSDYIHTSVESAMLSDEAAVRSPCAGAPCNASQLCVLNRNCRGMPPRTCQRYYCLDGCSLGEGSNIVVPHGSWVRIPMTVPAQRSCYKLCQCSGSRLRNCQPLPCFGENSCQLHDKSVPHGAKYYMECNACACVWGERVCARRACGAGPRLPCFCPATRAPARDNHRYFPNACLAKCAGARDAEVEFGESAPCGAGECGRRACLPAPRVCFSRLQANCPQHYCVNTSECSFAQSQAVCDVAGRTHDSPCRLALSGRPLAYWGPCLQGCSKVGLVCGVDGITYDSECAAWAEHVTVDYNGPCAALGLISDAMEPKCIEQNIVCLPLKKPNCLGFTAPGACCPKCGGALRILFSKKQIDRALYGTNVSNNIVNLNNILQSLERFVQVAECDLRGYLTIETEIFVMIESNVPNPTDLQLRVCVLEAEKIADLINRESALVTIDLGLSALSYALIAHTTPTQNANREHISYYILLLLLVYYFIIR